MSVIPYYSNPDAVKAFAWACKTAMYSVFGPNAFMNVDKKTVSNLKQLGIELYPLNWGGHFSISFGRMHIPEAAQVIMAANAATYVERYEEKVDLKDGDFALKLAHQLRDALTDLIMYVNTGL